MGGWEKKKAVRASVSGKREGEEKGIANGFLKIGNPGGVGARRGSCEESGRGERGSVRCCASRRERSALCAPVCRSSLCTSWVRTGRNFHFKSSWISPRLKPLPPSNQMGPRGDWRVKGMWRSPLCKRLYFDSWGGGGGGTASILWLPCTLALFFSVCVLNAELPGFVRKQPPNFYSYKTCDWVFTLNISV